MKYYHNLYMSDECINKKKEIIYKLEHDKIQWNQYIIVLTDYAKNQLEFYDSALLLQRRRKKDLFVVGIANGYDEALSLVEKITQEVYDRTGDVEIRTYLLERQKEYEEGKA